MREPSTNVKSRKILIVCTTDSMIWSFLIPHIEKLKSDGYSVDCACSKTGFYIDELRERHNLIVHEMNFSRSPIRLNNLSAFLELKNIINREKYELIHCHEPVGAAIGRLAGKATKTKVFYTAHGFHFYKGAPILNWLVYYPIEKWLARYTDTLITINKEDYERAKSKFKAKRVEYIPGVGIDLKKFQPQTEEKKHSLREKYGYSANDFILMYAGELSYRKYQDLLISVAGNLKDRIPNLKILLAGNGDLEEQYRKQIQELGVHNQVELLGFRKDIDNLMNLADLAVSASRQEGLPVNVMEAMATGLPLVVTDCRGNRDLVTDNENGYVVGIDDVEKFADSVEKIHKSKELRGNFGKKSLENIKKYSLENVIKEVEKIYKLQNEGV